MRDAVSHPLDALDGLHVLAAEIEAGARDFTLVHLDEAALAAAHRPITLVVRINGARPIEGLSLAPIVNLGEALRASGVDVAGLEVDHDCATARLADYAAWLTAHRPAAPLRFSITALPTWAEGPALAQVARAIDEIVVQVHAVRAPAIFDGNDAWRDLARFARAVPSTRLRVALPTYSAVVRGDEIGVDPDDVAAFVKRLARRPIAGVLGIVWFRLPVVGDDQTWSPATFTRVVTGHAPDARARIALVERGADRFDVVVTNPSDVLVDLPPVHIEGAIAAADLVQGYRERKPGSWEAPRRSLAGKAQLIVGWIHGKDLELVE
ncbi:MAG: DUF3142 domain-containing protein [Myxococcales bacterium]|nr:DUF3142 domain-containing protein [Myxococcales bacterium]